MYLDDDENPNWPEREQHVFEEKVERIGGAFVEPEHTQVDCNNPENGDGCATDEYPEDPFGIDNRTGTVDDVTYSMGVELPNAADLHVHPEGGVRQSGPPAPDEEREWEPGELEERDLWRRQRPLIEEDVDDGIKLPEGTSDEEAQRILDALGDESADPMPGASEPGSATGSPTVSPDHGGFPERDE